MTPSAQDPNECFDVVDAHDRVIGQRTRAEVHALGLFHRAVHVFVFREDGQLLLQQRSLLKDSSPGQWTSSCSGHLDTGEAYLDAALRELAEEIGLHNIPADRLEYLFTYPPCEQTGQEFVQVYRLVSDQSLTPAPLEVQTIQWITPTALSQWLQDEPEAFAPSFAPLWEHFLAFF